MASALPLHPPAVDLADVTVSAVVSPGPDGAGWEVTALVDRPPDQAPLPAEAVIAELLDDTGRPLPLVRRDEGTLTEAGGGLGVTANAGFLFGPGRPATLRITYDGTPATFEIGPVPGH